MKILRNLFLVLTTNFTYTTFCLSAKSFMFLNICRNYYYLYDMYVQRYKSTGENGKVYTSTLLFTKYRQARQQYKNLQHVEHAFRDFKSDNIQIRPVYHRNEAQTRGHVLLSMFSYAIVK